MQVTKLMASLLIGFLLFILCVVFVGGVAAILVARSPLAAYLRRRWQRRQRMRAFPHEKIRPLKRGYRSSKK